MLFVSSVTGLYAGCTVCYNFADMVLRWVGWQVKGRLQTRLAELEPIPELLQATELRLQDTSERLQRSERRSTDSTRLIAELTAKVRWGGGG